MVLNPVGMPSHRAVGQPTQITLDPEIRLTISDLMPLPRYQAQIWDLRSHHGSCCKCGGHHSFQQQLTAMASDNGMAIIRDVTLYHTVITWQPAGWCDMQTDTLTVQDDDSMVWHGLPLDLGQRETPEGACAKKAPPSDCLE